MTTKEKALSWWGEKIKNDSYVVSTKEIERRQQEYLRKRGYLFPVGRGFYLIKKPEDDGDEVFTLVYWQVVEKVLSMYSWSVRSSSALRILNGDYSAQESLAVITKEKTNKNITLPTELRISLQFDPEFDARLTKQIEIAKRKVPVDVPERVLIDISRLKSKEALSFVAGTEFDPRLLDAIYARSPKPVVYKRLIALAKEAGRSDLAARLQKTVEDHTTYQVIKKGDMTSAASTKQVVFSPPWVIRQEALAKEFEAALTKHLKTKIARIQKHSVDELLKQAKENKKYDTYHSTSLEGYRITPEDVDALLSGQPPQGVENESEYFDKLRNQMAILGYSEAFDFILENVKANFGEPLLSEDFVKDAFYNLFKPSVEAGVVDIHSLTAYRNIPVYIRGTRYAPPSFEKLPELMASYAKLVNEIENPVIRAILAHYFFVTIHPYVDGNGRTARLLMNYCLLASGYPWVTIRTEQRVEYFEALEAAQLDEDILPFGNFILGMLKEAGRNKKEPF